MVMMLAGEVMRRSRNKRAEKRLDYDDETRTKRRNRALAAVGLASCVGLGVAMSFTEGNGEVVETTANGGVGTVVEIDRTLSEHHVIGFKTEVDGATAERKLTNRTLVNGVPVLDAIPGVNAIPAPDIVASVRVDDFVVSSDLCFPGGKKTLEQTEINGVTHIKYELDPADIRVCSAEDVMYTPAVHHDGNWIQNMNDASAELNKMFPSVDDAKDMDSIKKANAIKEDIRKVATNAALLTVNRECAPKVLEITEKDLLERIAEDIGRDGEVVTVTLKEGAGHVFEGLSEVDEFFKQKKAEETDNIKWNFNAGVVGKCTVAADFKDIKTKASTNG